MFLIFKGPVNDHYQLKTREKMPKSFESYEDAREFLLSHFKRNFQKHGYDADTEVWWAKNDADTQLTGFLIQDT